MNEKQYFRAVVKENKRHKRRLAALSTVWRMLHHTAPPKLPAVKKPPVDTSGKPSFVTKAVLDIVAEMPDEFNTLDVAKILKAHHPELNGSSRSTVTHTLRRLAASESSPIAIVELGKGKRPTRYRKVAQGVAAADLNDM